MWSQYFIFLFVIAKCLLEMWSTICYFGKYAKPRRMLSWMWIHLHVINAITIVFTSEIYCSICIQNTNANISSVTENASEATTTGVIKITWKNLWSPSVSMLFMWKVSLKYEAIKGTHAIFYPAEMANSKRKCHVCNHLACNKYKFKRHLQTAMLEKPFNCDICLKYIAQKHHLTIKIRMTDLKTIH